MIALTVKAWCYAICDLNVTINVELSSTVLTHYVPVAVIDDKISCNIKIAINRAGTEVEISQYIHIGIFSWSTYSELTRSGHLKVTTNNK